jgi:hypothetical protein
MTTQRCLTADILTPEGFVRGDVCWDEQGRIVRLDASAVPANEAGTAGLPLALPRWPSTTFPASSRCGRSTVIVR